MSAVIRLDTLDGGWETLGADRYVGIVPEAIEATSNPWGPDQLSFQIKAEPGAMRPDLLPYTPVELEIDGILVWTGRIREKPSAERDHSVSCQGWQYHLDDDVFDRVYVHTRLSDYRDQRGFLGADLTRFTAVGDISGDGGATSIGWRNGTVIATGNLCGVTLDLGPEASWKRIVIDWDKQGATINERLWARTHAGEDPLTGSSTDALSFTLDAAPGVSAGTFSTPYRYVSIFIERADGPGTFGADVLVRLKSVKLFRATAYESGNASILKADTVVKDARSFAPLLNQANDYITAGTFSIPEAATRGYQSPRELMEAVNAYENYRQKIGGADLKTLVYDPKPAAPLFEVGNWSGTEFADASVSGDEIYSRAVVDGTGPDGGKLVSSQTQTGTLVDRNGFVRARVLPINAAMTQAVADRLAQLWLLEHRTAPFSGKLSATGGIRRIQGGASVPVHELLLHAGEMIRHSHRLDPDTGAWGRDGKIAGVTYHHDTRSVDVAIDDRRDHFESIIGRYGVLVDQLG